MSLNQRLEQVFPSEGKHKVGECLVVPLNIRNFLHVELNYEDESGQMNEEEEIIPTPDLVRKTEAINDGRGNQQIALLEVAFLHFGFSDDIERGDGGCNRDTRIFHTTSTHV